ncbi:hypothetical protein B0T14DRAFT_578988 [Immersiella caudata]|uniref:Histone-lysine N-methyltransferase SET9 n=1 Tax=Immersiella caudata TaxID=314043 RepID=A0AA40C7J5_9PEZI|nr:hypothetical protein B0T14DRAFT_578988 [Immersiella caudata]
MVSQAPLPLKLTTKTQASVKQLQVKRLAFIHPDYNKQSPHVTNALLAYSRGQEASEPCAQCRASGEDMPFPTCVFLPERWNFACACCIVRRTGNTCTFYTSNKYRAEVWKQVTGQTTWLRCELTATQFGIIDDFLTDAFIRCLGYRSTIRTLSESPKSLDTADEAEVLGIVQNYVIKNVDLDVAVEKLLLVKSVGDFYHELQDVIRHHFTNHLRRYLSMYPSDCPFEINSTDRFGSNDASVTARQHIKRGAPIRYLTALRVVMSPEEELSMVESGRDFSTLISDNPHLLAGPARFINHDCDSNAEFKPEGRMGIQVVAKRDIRCGEEITISYAPNYFGEGNCECKCATCGRESSSWNRCERRRGGDMKDGCHLCRPKRECWRCRKHFKLYGLRWPVTSY